MHKSATKCNETVGKWCKNKHGASKIIDTLETYHTSSKPAQTLRNRWELTHALHLVDSSRAKRKKRKPYRPRPSSFSQKNDRDIIAGEDGATARLAEMAAACFLRPFPLPSSNRRRQIQPYRELGHVLLSRRQQRLWKDGDGSSWTSAAAAMVEAQWWFACTSAAAAFGRAPRQRRRWKDGDRSGWTLAVVVVELIGTTLPG
jgi:hypothetical protein